MATLTCAACNAPLVDGRPRYKRCTNANCPAGGEFRRCGYCGEYSQATKDRGAECYNSSCRFHHVRLEVCPTCRRYSLMARRSGEPFCLWRDCPSNESIVQGCEFCGTRSFLRADGIDMCAKSKCPALLKQMRLCAFCHRWMVDASEDKCLNTECEHHGEAIVECPSCGQRTYSLDHDRCWNSECDSLSTQALPATEDEPDLETLQTLAPIEEPPPERAPDPDPAPLAKTTPPLRPPGPPPAPEAEPGRSTLEPEAQPTFGKPRVEPETEPPPPEETEPPGSETEPMTRVEPRRVSPSRERPPQESPTPPSDVKVPLQPASGSADAPAEPAARPLQPSEPATRKPKPTLREPGPGFRQPTSIRGQGGTQPAPKIDIATAFEAVRAGLLSSQGGSYCPLILVMGTAGSGKTAFLSTLGKILRDGAALFAFPHPGVAAEPLRYDVLLDLLLESHPSSDPHLLKKELRERVEDLAYSYSTQVFDQYIARGIWCEFTRPDFGQFLVANVTRRGQPMANVVTLETSGENFQSLLQGINDLGDVAHFGTPIVKTMAEMLTLAQGLVIVMDPSSTKNDQIYQPFFQHLARHLGHRVHTELDREIRSYLDRSDVRKRFKPGGTATERISPLHREGAQEAARRELGELRSLLDRTGALALESERPRFQRALDAISKGPKAGIGAKIQARIDNSSGDLNVEVEIWSEVLKRTSVEVLADELFPEVSRTEEELTISSEQALARQICVKHGVAAETAKDFDLEAGPAAVEPSFPHLRDIALVFSKSDMYPVVYPPDGYPRLKLPATSTSLSRCGRYLRYLGGDLRYYNTSVLGYSAHANGQFFPGNEASLTPVNVIEPVFDMLSDKLAGR